MAGRALAAVLLDEGVEIVAAVVVGDLVARVDGPDRADQNLVLLDIGFGVRLAGMVDVAGDVPAARAVGGSTVVDLGQVLGIELVRDPVGQLLAGIVDDEASSTNELGGEKAEAGFRATNTKRSTR